MSSRTRTIVARAPAKVILLGEHAVNRGQNALAVSVGRYATCEATCPTAGPGHYVFRGGGHQASATRRAILELGQTVDTWRAGQDYPAIQDLAARDFFAPTKYALAALGDALPDRLDVTLRSDIPPSAGLGSGGAAFVALVAAVARLLDLDAGPRQIGAWARRGDVVAHGGIASGLDTQTSLYGGLIRYTVEAEGEPIECAPGLQLILGNTGVVAATSEVNGRVRRWLAEQPVRTHYFREIGLLARQAEATLRRGDWPELGCLLNLNQLVLERIGVSCLELERLIDAALAAGALGAKLSGSGGGGIMLALVEPDTAEGVARAITEAGGAPIVAPIGVPGVQVEMAHPVRGQNTTA